MWQANFVKSALERAHPGLRVDILGMTTEGDRNKESPLSQMGGKGVFVKELEVALLENRADIAVHSMKDVPSVLPPGLELAVERKVHPSLSEQQCRPCASAMIRGMRW